MTPSSATEVAKVWVAGRPAPFATAGERPWKVAVAAQVPASAGLACSGMVIEFTLEKGLAWPAHPDIDNLCEPVFSTVINRLRWFGGSRPNLDWFLATKRPGAELGAMITVLGSAAPDVSTVLTLPALAATWPGPLPRSARDEQFATWVRDQRTPPLSGTLAVALEFGGSQVNIGDIATGPVKSVIDCLQPTVGGPFGNPDDHRIVLLLVRKRVPGIADGAVRLTVGHTPEGAPRGATARSGRRQRRSNRLRTIAQRMAIPAMATGARSIAHEWNIAATPR